MVDTTITAERPRRRLEELNGPHHKIALSLFLVVVLAHWVEHIAQAIQIYVFGWPVPEARGALGIPFPWLIGSEWLHYGYALVMLIGLAALLPGFTGRARTWWKIALGIQIWHHMEHLLLLIQATTGFYLLGRPIPTSIVQLIVPRVELHLFYNAVVFLPMVVAMVLHRHPTVAERRAMTCVCAHA
ncbi:MAG: hypothetical protein ACRDZO_13760 [Egibacteraceae bacterium]